MFNKDSFLHYHSMNSRTGFNPTKSVYEGFVQDAEGKPWGWLKSMNLYEQQETGIRMDPAEFQRYNIDILGYGSNDGGSFIDQMNRGTINDYTTNVDGIFEYTGADKALNTNTNFDIVTNSTGNEVDTKLVAVLSDTTTLNLREGNIILATFNGPAYIGLYIADPSDVAGWYIAEDTGSAGNYSYVRSTKKTSFPDPITTELTAPFAITFYDTDPGLVTGWSDYTPE
jgi:hypothetical protein